MRSIRLVCHLSVVLAGTSCLGEPAPLKVITFNAQFLSGLAGALFNKRADAEYRARTLGRLLAEGGYDVIALNEAFDHRARAILTAELKQRLGEQFRSVTPPPSEQSVYGIGSGLMLVSRLPILTSKTCVYGNDSNPLTHWLQGDGYVKKGIIFARLGSPGNRTQGELDVFVTHLESVDRSIRDTQVARLAGFIRGQGDAERPCLILGDLNLDGRPSLQPDDSEYGSMMAVLRPVRPNVEDLWPRFHSTELGGTFEDGKRIDYILLSSPPAGSSALRPLAIRINSFLDAKVISLSDHSAVEADFAWSVPPLGVPCSTATTGGWHGR